MKRKMIEVNLAHSFMEAEKWNRQYWLSKSANERFSAAWLMIKDMLKMKGKRGNLPRLRRSVQNLQQIKN